MHVHTPFLNLPAPTPPMPLMSTLLVYQGGGTTLLLRAEPSTDAGRVTLTNARPVTDDLTLSLLRDVLRQQERMTLVDHAQAQGAPNASLRPPGPLRPPVLTRLLLIYHNQKSAVVLSARPRLQDGQLTLSAPAPITAEDLRGLLGQLQAPPLQPSDPAVVGYSRRGVACAVRSRSAPAGGTR